VTAGCPASACPCARRCTAAPRSPQLAKTTAKDRLFHVRPPFWARSRSGARVKAVGLNATGIGSVVCRENSTSMQSTRDDRRAESSSTSSDAFVAERQRGGLAILEGEAGVGRGLWSAAADEARARGSRVLLAAHRSRGPELVRGASTTSVRPASTSLPAIGRCAGSGPCAAARGCSGASGAPPVVLGLLSLLERSAGAPVLVAVDDGMVDAASANVSRSRCAGCPDGVRVLDGAQRRGRRCRRRAPWLAGEGCAWRSPSTRSTRRACTLRPCPIGTWLSPPALERLYERRRQSVVALELRARRWGATWRRRRTFRRFARRARGCATRDAPTCCAVPRRWRHRPPESWRRRSSVPWRRAEGLEEALAAQVSSARRRLYFAIRLRAVVEGARHRPWRALHRRSPVWWATSSSARATSPRIRPGIRVAARETPDRTPPPAARSDRAGVAERAARAQPRHSSPSENRRLSWPPTARHAAETAGAHSPSSKPGRRAAAWAGAWPSADRLAYFDPEHHSAANAPNRRSPRLATDDHSSPRSPDHGNMRWSAERPIVRCALKSRPRARRAAGDEYLRGGRSPACRAALLARTRPARCAVDARADASGSADARFEYTRG